MAGEMTVRQSLQVKLNSAGTQRHNKQVTFRADATLPNAPSPGLQLIPTTGRTVDLSELTQPGVCMFTNLDPTNYVSYGPIVNGDFVYWGELLPGESWMWRFSRNLGEVDEGVGTGTGAPVSVVHLRANTASCEVLIEVFEA